MYKELNDRDVFNGGLENHFGHSHLCGGTKIHLCLWNKRPW